MKQKYSQRAINKALNLLIGEGKIAKIKLGNEEKYINSYQVIIKCPKCNCIINVDKKCSKPPMRSKK